MQLATVENVLTICKKYWVIFYELHWLALLSETDALAALISMDKTMHIQEII